MCSSEVSRVRGPGPQPHPDTVRHGKPPKSANFAFGKRRRSSSIYFAGSGQFETGGECSILSRFPDPRG